MRQEKQPPSGLRAAGTFDLRREFMAPLQELLRGLMMPFFEYIGYLAAACTTAAYVPQVLRVWRTRSTEDISLKMFIVLVTGLCLWLIYGIVKTDIPLTLSNSATLALASTILYFKIRKG